MVMAIMATVNATAAGAQASSPIQAPSANRFRLGLAGQLAAQRFDSGRSPPGSNYQPLWHARCKLIARMATAAAQATPLRSAPARAIETLKTSLGA
ncbi:MAG: hypothetical protein ACREFR_02070 [Limisphaerales bacterium]